MLLKSILHPSDIKSLTHEQLQTLVYELRSYIIETILEVGGHFAGNLGVVELTVALHNILDFNNNDSLIWDVGHQSYVHKCLTGRYKNLPFIRTLIISPDSQNATKANLIFSERAIRLHRFQLQWAWLLLI